MQQKKGLTIIECLISIIILAIILTAGMAFYFNAQASMRWSINKRIAVEIAGAELESIKNRDYANITPGVWSPVDMSTDTFNGTKNVEVSDIGDYKQIHVVVGWQDEVKKGNSSVSLYTYIAPLN